MQPAYLLLAQTILTEPEHQGIALGAIVVGVIAGILIALGILVPPALVLWRKFKPTIQEIGKSINAIAAQPTAPDSKSLVDATRDGVREAFLPLADSVKELIGENKSLRETAEDRATMNAGLQDRISRLEQQAETDKKNLQTQIDTQCVLIEKQNARIDTLQQTIDKQNVELQTKNAALAERDEQLKELAALKAQVNELSAEVTRLKAQLSMQEKLQIDLAAAQEAIRVKDQLIADLTKERDELKAEKLALQQRLDGKAETIKDLAASIGVDARADNPPADAAPKPPIGSATPAKEPSARPDGTEASA